MGLAVDAIKTSEIVDVIIVASGDGDYVPLVEYLKNQRPESGSFRFRQIGLGQTQGK